METWKGIEGYEGLYEVSDLGRIRSLGRECNSKNGSVQKKNIRILTQEITVWGYCRVRLYDRIGKPKHYAVHRLVYETFFGNLGESQVNHKNEIKTDNRLCNLEKVSAKDNCNYGTRNKRLSEKNKANADIWSLKVEQLDENGNIIKRYDSRKEAERQTGINNSSISNCCLGKSKTAGGYRWRNVIYG